jgi:hypothetical protein
VVVGVDCIQKRLGGSAGDVRCAGELRPRTGYSIPCDNIKEKGLGRCASAREREGDRNRVAGDLVIVGIGDEGRRGLQTSARNPASLAASRAGETKGRWERRSRLLIGVGAGKKRPALNGK